MYLNNYHYNLSDCDELAWDQFEDFTTTLTTDLVSSIERGVNPSDIHVTFSYGPEGTLLLVDNYWYIRAIHNFAHKYSIPLKNITVKVTNAKFNKVYNKWHKLHAPNEDKINHTLEKYAFQLYTPYGWEPPIKKPKVNLNKRPKKFNCLNGNPMPHRVMLLNEMHKKDLLDTEENIISFHFNRDEELLVEPNPQIVLPIEYDKPRNKLLENHVQFTGDFSHIYNNTYFTVTTEGSECYTLADWHTNNQINEYLKEFHEELFITEKTVRAFFNLHPQIIVGSVGTLDYLKQLGFKTFSNYWSEDYDTAVNGHARINLITDEIKKLNAKSQEELHEMYVDMLPILKHNQEHLVNFDYENIPYYA